VLRARTVIAPRLAADLPVVAGFSRLILRSAFKILLYIQRKQMFGSAIPNLEQLSCFR